MKTEHSLTAAQHYRVQIMAQWSGYVADGLRFAQLTASPFFDMAVRLWLGQLFWVSGILKVADWNKAIDLATYEYPVTWLEPVTAAFMGVTIEVLGATLLMLGLATRFAAVSMLALTVIAQIEYQAINLHLYWIVLLGWYVVMGAGAFSLDRLLGPGLAASALPGARWWADGCEFVTHTGGTAYLFLMRAVMAAWITGLLAFGQPTVSGALGILIATLLVIGGLTRMIALLAVILLLGMGMNVSNVQQVDIVYGVLILGWLVVQGPGWLSLDHVLSHLLRRRWLPATGWQDGSLAELPQVVIVGAGFGGLKAAHGLRLAACRITLIDKNNYHLFQPLLYQVATASLSPADIATPIRRLFQPYPNVRVVLGHVTGVDRATQQVLIENQSPIHYDYLILATGAQHSYFGRDDWAPYAPGLKRIEDATAIRRRLLLAFEQAENADDPVERQRLLTFIIVGGGPTGVELAGAIAELARHGLTGEFRRIDPATARVILVQSAPRLLPPFPERLSAVAAQSLRDLGVEVQLDSRVEQVDADGVTISGQRLAAGTVLWAAGVVASPAAQWLQAPADRAGRVKVEPDLSVPGQPNVFAIGDTALIEAWQGQAVPGLAPAAKQAGDYVAKVIRARLAGQRPPQPFRYQHLGNLATIGRQAAVVDFGRVQFSGALAWWLWGAVHVLFLVEMRKRIAVAIEWFWAYLTFKRGTRLITGG